MTPEGGVLTILAISGTRRRFQTAWFKNANSQSYKNAKPLSRNVFTFDITGNTLVSTVLLAYSFNVMSVIGR